MAAGRLYETSINVTVTDTSGLSDTKELVVNIEGTNTAPVITSGEHGVIIANPAPLVEDGGVSKVTGQVTAREYDEGDHVVAFKFVNDKGELVDSLTGKYGTISIDKDGNYTYTFNNGQAQHLGAGEMAAEHFNVVAVDTYGAQTTTPSDLQIQIQGTNDAPVITSLTPVLNLTELASGQAEITGTITFNDADKKADGTFHDTHTFSVRPAGAAEAENGAAAEGKYGTLTIDEHGNYKYTLTSDALGEGDKYTETFTATVDDGNGGKATQTITVNLTGTNDAPVITESHTYQRNHGVLHLHRCRCKGRWFLLRYAFLRHQRRRQGTRRNAGFHRHARHRHHRRPGHVRADAGRRRQLALRLHRQPRGHSRGRFGELRDA